MWLLDQYGDRLGNISDLIGILTALFALFAWQKARSIRRTQKEELERDAEPIRLVLVRGSDGNEHVLGYQPRRDQATRNEVLGILGMYYGKDRFDSSHLVPILENGDFGRMIAGESSQLRFTVSAADYERFTQRDRELGGAAETARPDD